MGSPFSNQSSGLKRGKEKTAPFLWPRGSQPEDRDGTKGQEYKGGQAGRVGAWVSEICAAPMTLLSQQNPGKFSVYSQRQEPRAVSQHSAWCPGLGKLEATLGEQSQL